MNAMGMKRSACSFVAAVFVLAVPSIARAQSFQIGIWIDPCDPTPIIVDGLAGTVSDMTLPDPNAAGTAVSDGTSVVIRVVSPSDGSADGGTVSDQTAVAGTATLTVDPAGAPVDGTDPGTTNPDGTTDSSSSADPGPSANPLVAATQAIFPVGAQTNAVFVAPASGTFFGIALQNLDPADSVVSIDVWDASGAVVASASVALPSGAKISRDVSELFPGVAFPDGSLFQVTATVPVQMLGLGGNEVDGSVIPVLPTLTSL